MLLTPHCARVTAHVLGALLIVGCGESSDEPNQPVTIEKPVVDSGDEQAGIAGLELANPLRVIVTRLGQPVGDVPVTWNTDDGGAVNPSISVSGEDGIA